MYKMCLSVRPYQFRGVHSGNRIGLGRVSFDSVIFRICVATGHTRVGSVSDGSVED